MTNYIILALCLIIIISYVFEISSRYTRIPGVGMLILAGIVIHLLVEKTGFRMPNLEPLLPVIGTVGLILIVMEASLDIKLTKNKTGLVIKSVFSAVFLFAFFITILTIVFVNYFNYPVTVSLLNAIPLGIISSAVAISSSTHLDTELKEFIIYESSFSDIAGILAFNFILLNQESIGMGLIHFTFQGLMTIVLAVIVTSVLAILLHKINYHVNHVIILTYLVTIYVLAELIHLPSLFLVLVFGIALSNSQLIENTFINKYVEFQKFRNDVESFRRILRELTFVVRSFFFIMFGYYISILGLFDRRNLLVSAFITAGMLAVRWLFFRFVIRVPSLALIFYAPRGLITILLYLSIPDALKVPLINEEVVALLIFMTIILMIGSNFMVRKKREASPSTDQDLGSIP